MIQLNLEMPKTCKDCPLTYIDDDTYSVEGVRCCVLKRCCTDIIDKDKTCPLIKIDVLDKIRAEVSDFEEEVFNRPNTDYSDYAAVRHCLEIIDNYRGEP